MIPVRRPVVAVMTNNDDRIEEASNLLDDGHQALDVGVGRVPLIRRQLNPINRQTSSMSVAPSGSRYDPTTVPPSRRQLGLPIGFGDSGADFLRRQPH